MGDTTQIKCINKRGRENPHERISHVGGTNADGARWRLRQESAIVHIKNGSWRFFVSAQGKSVWAVVATHLGREYLKTEADGVQPNNLLSLPE